MVTEAQTRAYTDIMAGKRAGYGWDSVTADIPWCEPNAAGSDDRWGAGLETDAWGRLNSAADGKEGSCTDGAPVFPAGACQMG